MAAFESDDPIELPSGRSCDEMLTNFAERLFRVDDDMHDDPPPWALWSNWGRRHEHDM